MKTKHFLVGLMALAVICSASPSWAKTKAKPLPEELEKLDVIGKKVSDEIAPGVSYYHRYYKDLFGVDDGPISVHYLIIDWKKTAKDFSLAFATCGGNRRHPSEMATERRALAAVNGGYHATTDPTKPYFQMKLDGKVIPSMNEGGDTSLAFNHGEMPVIESHSKQLLDKYENVLSGDGITGFCKNELPATKAERQKQRAPRTFVGQNAKDKITVIALCDGRSKRSIGMSYTEESKHLKIFGCEKMVSLDGGGSSVMVVRDGNKAKHLDIVNVPSDGCERRVCDALLLLDKKSLAADEVKGKGKKHKK